MFTCTLVSYKSVSFIYQKDASPDIKTLALKWLPLLLSSLGSFSFHLMTDILPGVMTASGAIQEEIAKIIGPLACVLTDNTVIRKMNNDLCFDDAVCNSITFLCPDCDSEIIKKRGSVFTFDLYMYCRTVPTRTCIRSKTTIRERK